MESKKLMKMVYYDLKSETRLEAYSDTIVIEKECNVSYLAAVRLGGYPESVKGMSDAIYGGSSVSIELDGKSILVYSRLKQYRKEFSHDGVYAEATLLIQDTEQRNDSDNDDDSPRKCYLFCEHDNSDRLFEELDKKTSVPLIPAFKAYVLSELQKRSILRQLQVISSRENFDVWVLELSKDEENIIAVVNDGLKSGAISIPGADADGFPDVRSVTQYLNTFAAVVTGIAELRKIYDAYQRGNKTCYIIISKEKARDGYMRRPAVTWNRRRKAFVCPDCNSTVEMELTDDGSKYRVPADQFYFKRENKSNHKCEHCGTLLWTALVPDTQSEWIKVSYKVMPIAAVATDILKDTNDFFKTIKI